MKKIYRLSNVQNIIGLSRSSIYTYISQGLITKPIQIGARAVGWPSYEIEAILEARVSGKSAEEIKNLVRVLMAKRQSEVML